MSTTSSLQRSCSEVSTGYRRSTDISPRSATASRAMQSRRTALYGHRAWKIALTRLPGTDAATALTRDKWLLPLLYELGYGRPEALSGGIDLPPGLGETQPKHYPVSHQLSWPADGPEAEAAVP